MGAMAVMGAETPRYTPLIPSFFMVSLSMLTVPGGSSPGANFIVWTRTFTKSTGWPTRVEDMPPIPPERKLLRADGAGWVAALDLEI